MSEKTVFSYFNSIKQKTLQKLVNDIIDSTHNNNSQKLLYLLSQAIQLLITSSFIESKLFGRVIFEFKSPI